jgi:hypothetical protein
VLSKASRSRKDLLNQTIILSDSESDFAAGPKRFLPEQPQLEILKPIVADTERFTPVDSKRLSFCDFEGKIFC